MATTKPREFELGTLAGFCEAIWEVGCSRVAGGSNRSLLDHFSASHLHCSRCSQARRVEVAREAGKARAPLDSPDSVAKKIVGILFTLTCLQCHNARTAVVFEGHSGLELAILGGALGGISTTNTPTPVAYYLDQAHRSSAVGAQSASVAMYRAALEQLLFEQGYTTGMLDKKIGALEADMLANKAPPWAQRVDPALLRVLKDLGNGAIHPNGGDITKQAALDASTVANVEVAFVAVLDEVYERPARDAARLAKLSTAAKTVS